MLGRGIAEGRAGNGCRVGFVSGNDRIAAGRDGRGEGLILLEIVELVG